MVTVLHSAPRMFRFYGNRGISGKPAQNLTRTITSNHIMINSNKSHLISATAADRISTECNVTNYSKENTYVVIKRTNQTPPKSRANSFSRSYCTISVVFGDTTMEADWADTGKSNGKGLSLKITLTPIPTPHTTPTVTPTAYQSTLYPITHTTNQTTYPLVSKIGLYAIKYTATSAI